ncbi:unnamed protein product [Adineta steineri]|uniref:Uncharacterized protein n=1 Tax=Adineta steineri TaxID=433720 RepID=A0A819JJJ7_9BILA|nr:unnamed protein product [Adineta steineri]CAF3931134.1 unnamed protein product [Adineta steineri]
MKYDQRSIWQVTYNRVNPEQNDNNQQTNKWSKPIYTNLSQWSCCCSKSLLYGLIIGGLIVGVAFATILTLYLRESALFNINLVTNGNGEIGNCSSSNASVSPMGWNVNGPITQIYYNNTSFPDQNFATIGPSDRGECYFMGHDSASTSMWQIVNLTNQIDPVLIDSFTVKFNLSAWLGGITVQNDSVVIMLTFSDGNNLMVGNNTYIGPVLATDRANRSLLVAKQATGLVPVHARSVTILVTITRFTGTANNGDVDDIGFYLYQ